MSTLMNASIDRRRALTLACAATTLACTQTSEAHGPAAAADAGNPDVVRRSIAGDPEGGQALFVHDPMVDADYVARQPRTAFLTRGGKGYRLSLAQAITPAMFGAFSWRVATFNPLDTLDVRSCPNATGALQAFFDFVFSNDGVIAEVNGRFGISEVITIGPATPRPDPARQFRGQMILIALAPISGPMVHARNLRDHVWIGSITCVGRGGTAWIHRDVETGVRFTGDCTSFRVTGRIAGYYLAFANVVGVTEPSIDFLEWLTIGEVTAYACGAGPIIEDGIERDGAHIVSRFTVIDRRGDPGDYKQDTTLAVDALPPAIVDYYGRIGVHHGVLVQIDGAIHRVTTVDRARQRMAIFPWLDTSKQSGELTYIFGGNLVLGGGDANLYQLGTVESAFTSINYQCCALFPGRVAALTAQACTINMLLAGGPTRVSGGTTAGLYQENTIYGLVCASPGNVAHTLVDADNTDLATWLVLGPRNANGVIETPGLRGVLVQGKDGRILQARRTPGNHEEAPDHRGGAYAVDGSTIVVSNSDNFTIILEPYNFALERLFGLDWLDITITGGGAGGGPTGTIAIDAKQIAATWINGTPTAEFRGDGQPMRLVITADHETGAFNAARTPTQT